MAPRPATSKRSRDHSSRTAWLIAGHLYFVELLTFFAGGCNHSETNRSANLGQENNFSEFVVLTVHPLGEPVGASNSQPGWLHVNLGPHASSNCAVARKRVLNAI